MNFSGLSNRTALGKLMRLPLKLIPSETAVPILQGKLRGKRWITGSSVHGCWLGSYEYTTQRLFERIVGEGSVVFDVGANVGFYTLLASELVGPTGKVFSFEPVNRNVLYLEQHLALNSITNVTVIEIAISNCSGTASFDSGPNRSMGHLALQGSVTVNTASLDEVIASGKAVSPDYIKIDVEGAETLVLAGAKTLLEQVHPTIFLATHGPDLHRDCCTYLKNLGYHLEAVREDRGVEETDEILATYPEKRLGASA